MRTGARPVLRSTALAVTAALVVLGTQVADARAAAGTVTTWAELVTAARSGGAVSLGANVSQADGDAALLVSPGSPFSVDLAGHGLSANFPPDLQAGLGVPRGASLTIADSKGAGEVLVEGAAGAAAIGGAAAQSGGTVTVTGGHVSARGGSYTNSGRCHGGGAAFGGGCDGSGGAFVLTGGVVTANGGQDAAALGGGSAAEDPGALGGSVDVRGGSLTAYGSFGTPAIGGGYDGSVRRTGPVRVSGGTVTAYGVGPAGAINTEQYSTRAGEIAVLVSGGSLTAIGSGGIDNGPGIAGDGRIDVTGGALSATNTKGAAVTGKSLHVGPDGSATLTGSVTADEITAPMDNEGLVRIPASSGLRIYGPVEPRNRGTFQVDGTVDVQTALVSPGRITGTGTIHATDRIVTPPGATVADDGQGPAGSKLLVDTRNYTLRFDVNGVLATAPKDLHVYAADVATSEQTLPVPSAAPTGRTFAGWFTARSGGTQVLDGTALAPLFADAPSARTVFAQYAPPQQVSFTSAAARPAAGHLYRVTTTGGPSGNPVRLSVDARTTDAGTERAACTLSGATVSFRHVGSCVLAADQAGAAGLGAGRATQTITVTRGTQDIVFTAPVPASDASDVRGAVGDSVRVTTTRGDSPNPVALTVGSGTTGYGTSGVACALSDESSGSFVTYRATGVCSLDANQAGDNDYPAGRTSVDVRVAEGAPPSAASRTSLTLSPTTAEQGVGTTATATVTTPTGTPRGTVQFAVDGTDEGAPVSLATASGGQRASATVATRATGGRHAVTARFVPADATVDRSDAAPVTFTVAPAGTTTTVSVTATELVATVTGGSTTPTGTVDFLVEGQPAGTATLAEGVARLTKTLDDGDYNVQAQYSGDADHYASQGRTTVTRRPPSITARVSSPTPQSSAGWYRDAVTVTFTCTAGTAPISSCSKPAVLATSAAAQSATGTAVADDGRTASVTVAHLDIDRVRPTVSIGGVRNGTRYLHRTPAATCAGRDTLSGVASCRLTRTADGSTVTYRAIATDLAGNTATATARVTVADQVVSGATVSGGAYVLRRGAAYSVYAVATTTPRLLAVTRYPTKATGKGTALTRSGSVAGTPRWVARTTISRTYVTGRDYALNIKVGSTVHLVKFRIAAAAARANTRVAAAAAGPAPVTDLRSGTISDRSVRLSWTPPGTADYDGVTIRRAVGTTAPTATSGRLVAEIANGVRSFDDTGADPATRYTYGVFSRSSAGILGDPATTAATTTAQGTGWQPGTQIDPNRGGLLAVSCVSENFCAAVDRFGGVIGYDGERWSPSFTADPGQTLTSVSCVSATFCLAVDANFHWLRWDGARWLGRAAIDPAVDLHGDASVSCASATFCVAVSGERAASFDGTAWTTATSIDRTRSLTGVSCPQDGVCLAVDSDGYAVRLAAGGWGGPERIETTDGYRSSGPHAVSCATSEYCVVGDGTGRVVVRDGTWRDPVQIDPAQRPVTGMSCVSRTFCVAVTAYRAYAFDGATWTVAPDVEAGQSGGLNGVSCSGPAFCATVDGAGGVRLRRDASWSPVSSVDPQVGGTLRATACASGQRCVALDADGYALTFDNGFWSLPAATGFTGTTRLTCATPTACVALTGADAYVFDGTSWTRASVPTASDEYHTETLLDVSCPSASYCLMVSNDSVYRYDGSTWTWLKDFPGRYTKFEAVACASVTSCVVMGFDNTHTTHLAYGYDGSGWSGPTAAGARADGRLMVDLRCTTSTTCVGVNADGSGTVFDGTSWTPTSFVLPGADSPVGLSCASAATCVVVGGTGSVVVRNGVRVPLVIGNRPEDPVVDVACRSVTRCTAITRTQHAYELRTG